VRLGKRVVRVVLDGGALVNWMIRVESNINDGSLVPSAVAALAHGNPSPIAKKWASLWVAPEFYGVFGYGLTYGVTCAEWVPYQTASASLAMARRAFPDFPVSVLRQPPQLPFQPQNCRAWHVPKARAAVRDRTFSRIPTLVVSGGFDAKTGAQWGPYVARRLSHSTVITIPGIGHGAVVFSRCGQNVARSFLAAPLAPDTRCVAHVKPAPFK
jgi:pimeloyl-ACP methyl ester carboxylesterase